MNGQDTPKGAAVSTSKEESSGALHPSRSFASRAEGYGIAAGYEKPYRRRSGELPARQKDEYGSIPDSGYYGSGESTRPFKRGEAGYSEELRWYPPQYGEATSGYEPNK